MNYKKYKPSGVEWIGEIPEHWEMKKTKYCFKYTTGFTPPTGQNEYYDGEHIWITISDMNQKYLFDSSTKLSDEAIEKYKPEITPKGSLLFSFKLSVGKVAFSGTDVYTNEAIISILPNEGINLDYFYYILPDQLLRNANENIYGAKLLNQELIKNAFVIFPSLEEQTAIANYLDDKTAKIDSLIEKKKKLIELYKEERTAVINQAVTRGINPNVKLKDSGIIFLGYIPNNWQIVKFNNYIRLRHGYQFMNNDFTSSGIKVVKITQLCEDGTLDLSQSTFIDKNRSDEFKDILIKSGDILMALTGGTIGKIIKVKEVDEPLVQNYRVGHFSPSNNKLMTDFLFWILSSEVILRQIFYELRETGQPNIGKENFNSMFIALPPLDEQLQIVQHIEAETKRIDEKIARAEKEIELLQEYRTALISEVVTGKIKVIDN